MQGAQGMLVQNWPTVSSAAGKKLKKMQYSFLFFQFTDAIKKRNTTRKLFLLTLKKRLIVKMMQLF